jgi:NAD(P)-dependent dehydrogenase (short-subunit alcohol dehydrogenase family)
MTHPLAGGTAVITGAASGFGLEACRIAARLRMKVVMADIESAALDAAAGEIAALGAAAVLPRRTDVSKATDIEALGAVTFERYGAPHFVFNNAGVAAGGLVWEHTVNDWEWVLGVNLMGVAHGVRVFTPAMLEAASADPGYRGHIVNTASMAGLLAAPNMGLYNASKHAVVAISETLYQDLALLGDQVHAHLLCPFYVPTAINRSERNRPAELSDAAARRTRSQLMAQALSDKAIGSGKVSAEQVAQYVFDAIAENRFYVFSHPHALGTVQTRMEDVMLRRNPSDPFANRPEIREQLQQALKG